MSAAPPTERVSFPGATGHRLAALLDRPAEEPAAYCLHAHAFGSSKDLRASRRIARALVEKGFAVLRFDFTGLGESEGEFAETNFTTNLGDVRAAADFLREHGEAPRVLVGHSLGGAAVIGAAASIPESVAIATIAAPANTHHLRRKLLARAPDLLERGEAKIDVAGKQVTIRPQLLEDFERHDLREKVRELNRALLIFHSPLDEFVDVSHAARLFEAAKHPKSFVSLDDADHLLLARERDARFVAGVLAAWAARYLAGDR